MESPPPHPPKVSKRRLVVLPILAISVVGILIGCWLAFGSNTADFEEARSVRIPPGSSFDAVVDSLAVAEILGSRGSFGMFATLTGWRRQAKPGHYLIESGMSNWVMLDKIRKGLQDPIRISIPPGTRPAVVGAVLARDLGIDADAFVDAMKDPTLAAELETDSLHLFGRMRANTFDIFWTTDAATAVKRIHGWYDHLWTDERKAKAAGLGLTPDEVTTLASLVEWEAQQADERPTIAGVYLNRLLGRTSAGTMRLQADPTVQYALMQMDGGPMRRLFTRDYNTPHPYNTYLIEGLPPGPINNPSDSSIDAVLNAEEHELLYFVADGTGGHTFTRTLGEHMAAAREWSAFISEQTRIARQRRDSLRQDSLLRAQTPVAP